MSKFIKMNDKPVAIECVIDEREAEKDLHPSFWWNNRRYYLEDFIRTHNNPWVSRSGFPDFIHAMESDSYLEPLFLEIIDSDNLNIYQEVDQTMETRIIRDENGFWCEQVRFVPLEDWEPNDGWRTTYISSCPPENWPEKRG